MHSRLAEIFAREVLGLLDRKELLSSEWAERLLAWRHSGSSVHRLARAKTKPEAERVGKYMIRPLLVLDRLSFLKSAGYAGNRPCPRLPEKTGGPRPRWVGLCCAPRNR